MHSTRVHAEALHEEARQRWSTGNGSGALARLRQCLALVAELGDRRWQAELKREVGEIHHQLYELAEAFSWYQRAREGFAALGDPAEEGRTLVRLGEVEHLRGD